VFPKILKGKDQFLSHVILKEARGDQNRKTLEIHDSLLNVNGFTSLIGP